MLRKFSTSKVLVTGGAGQVGVLFIPKLQDIYGVENVLVTDLKDSLPNLKTVNYEQCDATDEKKMTDICSKFKPNVIYHLASMLSAPSEMNPQLALKVNIGSLHNMLERARELQAQIFSASTIAAFGEGAAKVAGDDEPMNPATIYGITKVHMELLGKYYHKRWGIDFRCVRIPIVTSDIAAGGGAASFTVDMVHDLIQKKKAVIPISPENRFPLIYLPDLLDSILQLMQTDNQKLTRRVYTMASIGVSAEEYVNEVKKYLSGDIEFKPDFRDDVVETWPEGTDSRNAERDWGHKLNYDLPKTVEDIIDRITKSSH